MDILRFITAGNVDDGKSTLIGRLLFDTRNIKKDIMEATNQAADNDAAINLAHITDGLRAEREQGITIDVAYKYFTTKHRKFIVIDAPGHFQFIRNLMTGASNADLMIILVDAGIGVTAQTKRHAMVASFLSVPKVVVAVNKMDSVGYARAKYERIRSDFEKTAEDLVLNDLEYIPVSALHGDNVITASRNMDWYRGPSLMNILEQYDPMPPTTSQTRFLVQYVCRAPDNSATLAMGQAVSGNLSVGGTVLNSGTGRHETIKQIYSGFHPATKIGTGENGTLLFPIGAEMARGAILTEPNQPPISSKTINAEICWLDASKALLVGDTYLLSLNHDEIEAVVTEIKRTQRGTAFAKSAVMALETNEIAAVTLQLKRPMCFDHFSDNRFTGRAIMIDPETFYTCGAIIITGSSQ